MRLLLDTHTLLWFLAADPRLSEPARTSLETGGHPAWVSVASLWEIAIKLRLGKLSLDAPFSEVFPAQLEANGIEVLPIQIGHLVQLDGLPFHHRDPFDRLLVAQAIAEGLTIVTSDEALSAYAAPLFW